MNEDLPLAETYPFNTNVVANALEPHMIKEAAFSDTEHTPLRDRLEASFKGYNKSNYTAMDQDKRVQERGHWTDEPTIATENKSNPHITPSVT